ncbi:hypothetical protein C0991_006668 [Blastosporella zonata]|nr:hypothetical protein C0991_006668 [Blastosporella zonata]
MQVNAKPSHKKRVAEDLKPLDRPPQVTRKSGLRERSFHETLGSIEIKGEWAADNIKSNRREGDAPKNMTERRHQHPGDKLVQSGGATSMSSTQPEENLVVHLGGVVFKGIPSPIPSSRSALITNRVVKPNRDADLRFRGIQLERDVAALWLSHSDKLIAMKKIQAHKIRRIARKAAKGTGPLGPEFVEFNSQPNPSFDPFMDMEFPPVKNDPEARNALLELLNKRSPSSVAVASSRSLASERPSQPPKSKRGESSVPDDFDPFSPLIVKEEEPNQSFEGDMLTDSLEEDFLEPQPATSTLHSSSNALPETIDFDPFPSTPPTPSSPESQLTLPVGSHPGTNSIEDMLQSFEPFHPNQPEGLNLKAPLASNLPPNSPSAALNSAVGEQVSRSESTTRLKKLGDLLDKKEPLILPWRMFRGSKRHRS